jgi:acylphosphatase
LAEVRIVVDGVVQGVGYGALVKQVARQFGLKGLVRNLEDTKVEIFCKGQENNIREFLRQIDRKIEGKDILGTNVTGIECYWEGQSNYRPAWKEYAEFEIDYQVEGVTPVDKETLESQEFAKLYFIGFRDEMKGFRHETNKNFGIMDAKYGDISKELKEFRKTVKEFLEAFLGEKRQRPILKRKKRNESQQIRQPFGARANGIERL